MGEDTQSQSRVVFHENSRAQNYRCKPNNAVKSFYVKRLSAYSYVNPENPAHSYNLRSIGTKDTNSFEIEAGMDHVVVPLADVIALLSEKADPRGLSVRQIREILVQSKKISDKVTDAHVRDALKKGIKERRIKKLDFGGRGDGRCKSRSRASISSSGSDMEDEEKRNRACVREMGSASFSRSDSSASWDSRSRSGDRKSGRKRRRTGSQATCVKKESSSRRSRSRMGASSLCHAGSGRTKSRDMCQHARRDSDSGTRGKHSHRSRHEAYQPDTL
ncbi:hypothetical protein EGW08_000289 [Elysia chlorotica]|uniref:Uncharacterized protein n=1 Tax=Elysia chlorotica TaxID=188477 RepID=A0A3S1BYA5_ELYCH|nr:hypothetical protein EGW08_000289 [Elysia chlorotica]